MKIPTVPAPDWHLKFAKNLDAAIAYHRLNTNDPHNVDTSAALVLTEVRELFGLAVCGQELPEIKANNPAQPLPCPYRLQLSPENNRLKITWKLKNTDRQARPTE